MVAELQAGTDNALDLPIADGLLQDREALLEAVDYRRTRLPTRVSLADGAQGIFPPFVGRTPVVAHSETQAVGHNVCALVLDETDEFRHVAGATDDHESGGSGLSGLPTLQLRKQRFQSFVEDLSRHGHPCQDDPHMLGPCESGRVGFPQFIQRRQEGAGPVIHSNGTTQVILTDPCVEGLLDGRDEALNFRSEPPFRSFIECVIHGKVVNQGHLRLVFQLPGQPQHVIAGVRRHEPVEKVQFVA
jgi:hypothetical protein